MSRVYVLLFNARTENEGIHTLQTGDRNKILMFEDEDDATRFGLMLEAQDFPPVSIEAMDEEDIIEFCRDADYDWQHVAAGELATPPEANVTDLAWDPEGKQQPAEQTTASENDLSDTELDRIRRQLEGLL
ncbi:MULTISPECIES: DUF3110 domain-containing protein [Cyanophyceae]|uniref:DUF3110 domain-containing protein n=1 Tax=Cyanophyceae TaxID=3028117 RepID=UPI00016DCB54|nr:MULTISPECIES: DUF3110 domain-containing protein [Cyanophyceae]ACA99992.1 conserved hypothetical protein [Picosynechococcus sp. PCC 7002]AMA09637.1 hypothetical protein AWQ23_10055 [Picosynechococcus sp. PCC 73109]ANV87802.1 hypothetical protein AWQ22_10190 [Picosynechococcus sp. PCC 7117]ANV90992.1 hypothetical protein AWQ24_10280 [Picosynechococcus sp. PCC 8807]QCS50504.1 DUF3110 domain-containing protein [Picosynechococcus sp. PCC 11901]